MATYGLLFTQALEDYRRVNRLTQADIANSLGVSSVAVSRKLAGVRQWTLADIETLTAAFPDFACSFPLLGDF